MEGLFDFINTTASIYIGTASALHCQRANIIIRIDICLIVVVLRVGGAWLVGVGKRAPHGLRCLWLASPYGSLDRLKAYTLFPLH